MLIWRQSIRHKAYWWRKVPNFGDAITPLLLRGLSGFSLEWSDAPGDNNLACVGSIVSHAKPGWVVWGAGCISADCPIPTGLTVHAVRGPLTRERMLHAGYQVPAVFGDPGLLMPLVKPLEAGQISHEWGIIPHFSDFGHPVMKQFQSSQGLNASGKIDALTLQKLGLGSETAGRGAPMPLSEVSGVPAAKLAAPSAPSAAARSDASGDPREK